MQRRRSPDGSELWLNWVLYDADPQPLGYVQASVLADGRAWVAWVLGRSAWGQGYATEAARAMLQHLVGRLQVRQALACIEQANVRSQSVAARLGFRRAPPGRTRGPRPARQRAAVAAGRPPASARRP
jgi:ribosomal-protein-alanine N-acetyltransferase